MIYLVTSAPFLGSTLSAIIRALSVPKAGSKE